MKKLLLVVSLMWITLGLHAQTFLNPSFYDFTAADTMVIKYSDNVVSVSIVVPSVATDSVILYGAAKTIDGKAAASIDIAPGEYFNYGAGTIPINYIYIVIKDKAQITTASPIRR